jgi:hypothetical protein
VAPLGKKVWGNTYLTIPLSACASFEKEPDISLRNVFTDEVFKAKRLTQGYHLPLQNVFSTFPAALLERV